MSVRNGVQVRDGHGKSNMKVNVVRVFSFSSFSFFFKLSKGLAAA